MKKFVSCIFALIFAISTFTFTVTVHAEDSGCQFIPGEMTIDSEPILINDSSFEMPNILRSPINFVSVNKTYQIYIQDSSGSCTSTAKVTITGYYRYNSSNGAIVDYDLSATMSYIPSLWKVEISSSWATIAGSKIKYSINYRSMVDDPYSCMVGGGYWYSGATFTLN